MIPIVLNAMFEKILEASRKNGETFRAAFVRQSLNRLKDEQIMA
jgi:hypothetical protein